MAHGAPDYTTQIQVKIVQAQPGDERAAGGVGNYNGILAPPQLLVTWTVDDGYVGELKEILIISDNYAATQVTITIAGVPWCTDWNPTSAMPIIFEDLRLAAGETVLVQCGSIGAVLIDVDGIIVAKEAVI
ncbi:unnamed protein product [marine sediment metagenome]|uniref:Uncharacterized protein n=1 Tax=marine sediment metagenome TaxID=412755 RepID=X1K9T0_9ZZZZ